MREEGSSSVLVRVWLLGEFQVERRGGDDAWEVVKREEWDKNGYAKRLLKRLLCMPRRRAQRISIIDDLWPNAEVADDYLNKAASKLRKVLGDDLLRTFGTHQSTGYELADQSLLWTDIDECDILMHKIERVGYLSVNALPLLQRAIAYFERGNCLEGDGGQWCHAIRLHTEQAVKRCRLWLAEAYETQGMQWHARTQWRGLLSTHPMDEEILCGFLVFLHRHRMIKDALALYQQTQVALQQQGIFLSEIVHELASRLENEQPTLGRYLSPLVTPYLPSLPSTMQGKVEDMVFSPFERAALQYGNKQVETNSSERPENIQSLNLQAHEDMLSLAWDAFYTSSAQRTARVVHNWLSILRKQIDSSGIETTYQLNTLQCRFLQLASVLGRDRTDFPYAFHAIHEAISLAYRLEDVDLIASSLYRRAKLYAAQQRYDLAIQDLEAALPYARRSRDPLRCYISMFLAEVYSLFAPGIREFLRKSLDHLDNVDQAVRTHNVLEGDGSYIKVDVAGLYMIRGDVLRRSGEIEEARKALSIVRASLPKEFIRWQGNLSVSEAGLFLADGDVENSCRYLARALDIFQTTVSLSGLAKTHRVYRDLQRVQPSHPEVVEVGERIALHEKLIRPGG